MQSCTDRGVDSVGTDQRVAFGGAAVVEPQDYALSYGLASDGLMSETKRAGCSHRHRIRQNTQQVRPKHRDVGMTIGLHRHRPEIESGPGLAGIRHPNLTPLRMRGLLHDAGSEAEFVKNKHAVGADLHTGPDLLKDLRLFVNFDLEATLDEGKGRRQPAYAAAGYENFGFCGFFHSLLPFLDDMPIALYRASGWHHSTFRPDRLG